MLVLKRPEVPLHTNGSERDIRGHVKKRKVSEAPAARKETLPGYIYESEKYLQKVGYVVLEISAGEDKWWSICAAS